ncbi:MAG: hypothetical protein JJE09_06385 [Bacteroidia bacterium]|nr:hypothetical protein [Bacteroidia bacterium]
MKNTYPVSPRLMKLLVLGTVCTVVWMILMGAVIRPLDSKQIVSFELAKTTDVATRIIKEWKEKDLVSQARKSIYLDFVFLVLYSVSIGIGCVVFSLFTGNAFLIQWGSVLSKMVLFAGLFDVIENLAMLKTLSGEVLKLPVAIAFWFATMKFIIVIFSLLFVAGCLIFGGVKRVSK